MVSSSETNKDEDSQNLSGASDEILMLRALYPDLIHNNNLNEDNWYCDICLDTGLNEELQDSQADEQEELAICDLCLVVVHPSCYRKDLYSQDPEDESSWFCQRC